MISDIEKCSFFFLQRLNIHWTPFAMWPIATSYQISSNIYEATFLAPVEWVQVVEPGQIRILRLLLKTLSFDTEPSYPLKSKIYIKNSYNEMLIKKCWKHMCDWFWYINMLRGQCW